MKRVGMQIRLIVAGILLIAATTGAVGFMGLKTIRGFIETRFEDRIRFLAHYVSLNAELGILIDQKYLLNQLAENLLTEKDVVGVDISNNKGNVLVSISRKGLHGNQVIEVPVVLKDTQEGSLSFQWGEEEVRQEKVIGSVKIRYSTTEMLRLRKQLTNRFILASVVLSGIGIILFFFISKTIVSQITRIVDAARKVSRGDMKERPVPGSLPETRELTLAFNSMLDSIEWSTKALEDAYQEMIQQNTLAELGKFSMMIAHEFKNPLSIIKGSLNNFKKRLPAELEKDLMVQYMDEEMTRLNRMIEDFLAFSKPLTPVFRSIDLNETLASCVEKFSFTAEAAQVDIRARVGGKVCTANADRDILGRVFGNLLKNAVESSGKQSRVLVSAEVVAGMWEMRVCDEGSGIPGEHMEKIFEPFFTTRAKGSGLGLAFARQVVKAHNGEIYAQNNENGGACFTVRLPLSAEAAAGIGGATTG